MSMDDIKIFAKNKKELETLPQNINLFNQDIGMELIWKMHDVYNEKEKKEKKVKTETTERIDMSNQESIGALEEIENCKYQGILEEVTIKETEMKEKARKVYS